MSLFISCVKDRRGGQAKNFSYKFGVANIDVKVSVDNLDNMAEAKF